MSLLRFAPRPCILGRLALPLLFILASPILAQDLPSETSPLSAADIRRDLAHARSLIASHPGDPAGYVKLAYALSDGGMEEDARAAAAQATQVAPHSAFAFNAQAWILRHNDIGVDFGKGFDADASVRSYQQAIQLDPKDLDIRASFANLLEYNRDGIEYGPGSQLPLAIENYLYVVQHSLRIQNDVIDNLAIALFYAGRYKEVLALPPLSTSPKRIGAIVAAAAASSSSAEAITLSNQLGSPEDIHHEAILNAAEGLWSIRLYSQAADLLTAALPDPNDRTISGKIQLFRNLQPYKSEPLPITDPRRPVQQLFESVVRGTVTDPEIASLFSTPSHGANRDASPAADQLIGLLSSITRQTGLPRTVLADLVLTHMRIVQLPSPGTTPNTGASVRVDMLGRSGGTLFLFPENNTWKIVASGSDLDEAGAQALEQLAQQHQAQAIALLNWCRDLVPVSRTDDPMGGLFPYLWTGANSDPTEALLAAASLTTSPTLLCPLLPRIVEARDSASSPARRSRLNQLLASVYLSLGDLSNARRTVTPLLQESPGSLTILRLAARIDALEHDWTAWKSMLAPALQQHPADRDLLVESATEAADEGDLARARGIYRTLLDTGQPATTDYNTYAWISLAAGHPDDQAVAAAQQATLAPDGHTFACLHTLASLSAARGNTAEARQEILEAMAAGHIDTPTPAVWYTLGLMDQQYGVTSAAIAAFHKAAVLPPGSPLVSEDPTTIAALARAQLKRLEARP